MKRTFNAAEVAKHRTPDSCWVVLYGDVYDVTSFLSSHPGGPSVILQLAGTDATEDYDPIHPPGTLEVNLPSEAKLGTFDAGTMKKEKASSSDQSPMLREKEDVVDLDSLLNLDEIEAVAATKLSKKAWAYYYSASDDLHSKHLNTAAYRSILFRPRIFVDCSFCSLNTTFLGHSVQSPIYVAPAAMARLAHPSGERGIATACERFGCAMIISQNASQTPEQIVDGAGPDQVFGWQLYIQNDRAKSEAMLARIEKLSQIKFVVLTLDAPVPGKREDDMRSKSGSTSGSGPNSTISTPVCGVEVAVQSHSDSQAKMTNDGTRSGGLGAALFWGTAADLTWPTTLPWLANHTTLPIVLKGVQTHEDAWLATQHYPQIRAIILSNHGGRALDTAPPAVHTLLEIRRNCPAVFERVEVFVDGGIRRGTDVVKALCLGARGVGIGRAPLFGLGVGGVEGVSRSLTILQEEILTAMKLLGVSKVGDLGIRHVNTRLVEREIYDAPSSARMGLSWWERVRAKL